jgi:anti-anti-sigma factor
MATLAVRVPDPWLSTQAHHRPDHIVARIGGELDLTTACTLHLFLHGLLAEQARLVVNTGALTFADAIGIRTLLIAAGQAAQAGGWVRLARARPHLRQLLLVLGVARLLPVYETESEAAHHTAGSASGPQHKVQGSHGRLADHGGAAPWPW